MTLIVGIRCEDGIVLGADSASTNVTSMGQRTSMQPTEKLDIIDDKIVLGVSGHIGLAQLFQAEIQKLWSEKKGLSGLEISEAMVKLSEAIRSHLKREFGFIRHVKEAIGNLALEEVITQTVIALPIRKKPCLIEFTKQGAPEEKNEKLPTVAIGSAQQIVDPFLGFLRRIFWPKRLPTLAEGRLAACWALDYGIKSAPGGVGEPKHLVVLEKNEKGEWETRRLTQEVHEHEEALDDIERHMANFKLLKQDKEIEEVEPPKPEQ